MGKIKFLLFFYFSIFISALAFNLSVSPPGFLVSLEKSETREVEITNHSIFPMRVQVFLEKPEEIRDEDYLSSSVKIYPSIVTVPPKSTSSTRFTVRTDSNSLLDGEYRANLVFRELPRGESDIIKKDTEESFQLDILTDVVVGLFAQKGKISSRLDIGNLSVSTTENGETYLEALASGRGNSSIPILATIQYLDESSKKIHAESIFFGRAPREKNRTISTLLKNISKETKYLKIIFTDIKKEKLIDKEFLIKI